MMPDFRSDPPTVSALVRAGAARLCGDAARREAELLAEFALGVDRAWLFAHADDAVKPEECARYLALLARRAGGEPLAYLLGHVGFWTLDLEVTPDTLIPRPETELLVDAALARLPEGTAPRVADLGTGSGAIALALASERPLARVLATDASAAALDVARRNAARNEVGNVAFRRGDWLAPLAGERFDLIASNPPYVALGDPHLAQGDLRFEPETALASGADGLDALRTLARGAPGHLAPGGWLLLEHGLDQGEAVRGLLRDAGFHRIETLRDLEGRERVTLGCRAPA
ncbi:peptide chain release factor N(5)-glutamine methyltransferase [Denitratimonas tolerans]|uniref:Release factor glutamine methyltransferase n=2 Tax=Denitratimonas tolerans TaxID=1338420 RepID=A0AAW9RCD6_9GAMM